MVDEIGRRSARPRSTLHCSVAPACSLVHCRAIQLAVFPASNLSPKESQDEQENISDRGHSRRRHRQGSGPGRPARARGGREKARRRRAFRPFRLRVLGLLRKARRDDAGGLEGQNRQARRDLFRRGRLAGKNPRSHFLVGVADKIPPGVRPVRQFAPGAADAGRAVAARQPQARRHRFLGGARKHRRRIFLGRRPHVPGYRP